VSVDHSISKLSSVARHMTSFAPHSMMLLNVGCRKNLMMKNIGNSNEYFWDADLSVTSSTDSCLLAALGVINDVSLLHFLTALIVCQRPALPHRTDEFMLAPCRGERICVISLQLKANMSPSYISYLCTKTAQHSLYKLWGWLCGWRYRGLGLKLQRFSVFDALFSACRRLTSV